MQKIIDEAKLGNPVIVLDTDKAALCVPAERITGEVLNFMMK
ncbi:MAG TPA: GTP cyclohydrolase II, partial [Archaeoglobus sp.]|nr:GTP cyclohydrolase II [Archaeoglobus sp.]